MKLVGTLFCEEAAHSSNLSMPTIAVKAKATGSNKRLIDIKLFLL
jgi:hypothetical protein